MSNSEPLHNPEHRVRIRGLSRLWGRPVLVCTIVLIILCVVRWWPHVMWKYAEARLDSDEVHAIPVSEMLQTDIPNDWASVRVDGMEFRLPSDVVETQDQPSPDLVIFQNGVGVMVMVARPADNGELYEMFDVAKIRPELKGVTLPKLRWYCCQASSSDFRWSMSHGEVRWHAFCMTAGQLLWSRMSGRAETLFRDDVDGIVYFDGKFASFSWEHKQSKQGGYINFRGASPTIDANFVRGVCESFKFSVEPHAEADAN